MTQGIQIKNLPHTTSLNDNASILALTDNLNNTVNLISKANLITSLISSNANNLLTSDSNGLLVNNIIGVLSNLDTTDKTSIVNAINEIVGTVNGIIDDIENPPIITLGTSGALTLTDNRHHKTTPTAAISFPTLPTISSTSTFHQMLVQVNLTSTAYLSGNNLGTSDFFNQKKPTFTSTGRYDLIYEYDSTNSTWTVGAIYKGVVS